MKLPAIDRARRYIAKCPSAISGQSGHNATFHVAASLVHGFALGEADALTLLREFNQRCAPPWSEGELIHKIKSAANTVHLLPRGHLLGGEAKNGRPVTAKPMPPPPPKPKFQKTVLARIANKVADIKDVVSFLADRSPVPVDLDVHLERRLDQPQEAALYFTASEALVNVAKYAQATSVSVRAFMNERSAVIEIRDDGIGGADASRGSGLRGLGDRVEAVGGWLAITSPPGGGTAVVATLPL